MVEVMVAILLAAIGTAGIVALYMSTTRASGFSRHSTEAAVLAEDKLEKLRTMSVAAMSTGSPETVDATGKVVTGGYYTRSWTVTAGASYYDIVVTVSWLEDSPTARSVTMRTRRNL